MQYEYVVQRDEFTDEWTTLTVAMLNLFNLTLAVMISSTGQL